MKLQFGLTQEFTNTQYAPLAALMAYYEAEKALEPLQSVTSATQSGDFPAAEKTSPRAKIGTSQTNRPLC